MIKIPNLVPDMVKLNEIIHYERNAKKHPKEQIDKIINSIKEFGFRHSIILDNKENKVIVCGHARVFAANQLDMKEIPVLYADDMTEAQIKAFRIADNRLTESEWDFDLLKLDFEGMTPQEISLTGFELDELNAINDSNAEVRDVEPEDAETIKTDIKLGDLFELGNHRLLCGDSTIKEDKEKLIGNSKIHQLQTDPPYGINYASKNEFLNNQDEGNRIQEAYECDDLEDYETFFIECFSDIPFAEYNTVYIFINGAKTRELLNSLNKLDFNTTRQLVWVKNNHVLGRMDYAPKHESIIYGWKGKHKFYAKEFKTDVLEYNKPSVNDLHPIMKPVELIMNLISDGTIINDNVLDLFGGSGTTLIACENTKRKAYIMEKMPKYCQVIINRWEKLTGQKARKI